MSWHIEDWGSALGTFGVGSWVQLDPYGIFGTGLWESNGAAIYSKKGSGRWGAITSGTTLGSCGSQQHVIGHTINAASITTSVWTRLASQGGIDLYCMHGYRFSGTGSSYLGFFSGSGGTLGTLAEGWASGGWTGFNAGFGAGIGTMSAALASGTWTVTWEAARGGSTGVQTLAYGVGNMYAGAPAKGLIGHYSVDNNNCAIHHYSKWIITDPPPDTILRFIGTWATGCGTYEWGGDVLGYPGDVQDRAYGPDDTAGWASTVSITLDNSAGQWGSFAGTSQLPFEGVWNLRQYWSGIGAIGSWVDLFTGYLEPDGVTVDYGRGQVKISLQSTIARAAQSIALLDGTAVSVRGLDVPCRQRLLGTIAAVDPDTGTARIGNVGNVAFSPWEAETGCLLWGTSGTSSQSIKIGSSITALGAVIPGGTGTVVLDGDIPPWMTVGAPAWITQAWPNYTARSRGFSAKNYVKSIVDGMTGLTWPADDMAIFTKQSGYSDVSPNDRLYGGEKLTTALSGIMRAINGFYSVDPSGNFRARCLLPTFSVSGTVDFNAAYDSDWQMSYEPAYSGIEMDCSYNVAAGSFTEHVSVGGAQPWGEVRDVESRWVGSGIEAQSIAGRLYRNAYLPRPSLTLRLAGSRWADYLPGEVYAIHNLPAQVTSLLSGTQMILYSRTYDWADDLTAFEFVAMPGGNYAVWDGTPADYWEGSGKVWY